MPTIGVSPAIQANVPEDEQAEFTLQLGNNSETSSNIWYELSIDQTTNPDGAVLLIDGVPAEKQYLVNANEILEKTLTIEKGATGVLEYDSIGIILHSSCQFNPESSQAEIADTTYVSVKFLAECDDVTIANMQESWILNYEDNNLAAITLNGYNVNHPTLQKIDFQYKTLTGPPVTVMTYFKDNTVPDYATFDGPKDLLNSNSEVTFDWDISSLNDRAYQVRARAHCADGSVYEMDFLNGIIDRSNPQVFGTPAPADGIYNAGDDIRIQFSEELEVDLIKDFQISVQSVLNGADVSHATSVQLDGINDEIIINEFTDTMEPTPCSLKLISSGVMEISKKRNEYPVSSQ